MPLSVQSVADPGSGVFLPLDVGSGMENTRRVGDLHCNIDRRSMFVRTEWLRYLGTVPRRYVPACGALASKLYFYSCTVHSERLFG